jgi:hypothetical protein
MSKPNADESLESEVIFNRLEARANNRTLKCLMNLKSACDLLSSDGLDISPAKVGAFTSRMQGGPNVQSIRNNKEFSAYVYARKSEQGLLESRMQFAQANIRTGDNRIDAYIRTLELEVQSGRQHLSNLKKAFLKNCTFDYSAAMKGELVIATSNSHGEVSEHEKAELRKLIDPAYLSKAGLELSAGGQLRNAETLRTVVGPDAIRAIQRICSVLRAP